MGNQIKQGKLAYLHRGRGRPRPRSIAYRSPRTPRSWLLLVARLDLRTGSRNGVEMREHRRRRGVASTPSPRRRAHRRRWGPPLPAGEEEGAGRLQLPRRPARPRRRRAAMEEAATGRVVRTGAGRLGVDPAPAAPSSHESDASRRAAAIRCTGGGATAAGGGGGGGEAAGASSSRTSAAAGGIWVFFYEGS